MKTKTVVVWAVAALMMVPVIASAQRGGGGGGQRGGGMMMMGGRGGGMNTAMLLMRKDVQKDLKLTADQQKDLEKAREAMMTKMRTRMEELRSGGQGGGRPDMTALREEFEKMQKESDEAVAKVLTDDQEKRLEQIALQMRGGRALMDEKIQKELGIQTSQRRKIEDLSDAMNNANREVMMKMRNQEISREQMSGIMEKNNKTMDAELMKILTADQKKKFEEMQGPKFKRDPKEDAAMRGGGRRGGGI